MSFPLAEQPSAGRSRSGMPLDRMLPPGAVSRVLPATARSCQCRQICASANPAASTPISCRMAIPMFVRLGEMHVDGRLTPGTSHELFSASVTAWPWGINGWHPDTLQGERCRPGKRDLPSGRRRSACARWKESFCARRSAEPKLVPGLVRAAPLLPGGPLPLPLLHAMLAGARPRPRHLPGVIDERFVDRPAELPTGTVRWQARPAAVAQPFAASDAAAPAPPSTSALTMASISRTCTGGLK
jgi:hypothetical protein